MESVRQFDTFVSFAFAVFFFIASSLQAADINECRKLLLHGEYQKCLEATSEAIEKGSYGESWHLVKSEAEFQTGDYEASQATILKALERYGWSVRLRWAGMRSCRYLNQEEQVEKYIGEIAQLVQSSPWRYTDAENLATLGRFILEQGADAKAAQDAFFTRAKRNNPLHRAPVLALGQLALEKRDFQLAAEIFTLALKNHSDDPDINFGLALAFAESDRKVASEYLEKTLKGNPNHAPALLYQVDKLIDSEQYDEAGSLLERVLKINPKHPEALAYRTVLEMLLGDEEEWAKSRSLALNTWKKNPLVDFTIGRKLSQKYRFQQGSTFQQQALQFDPEYKPAKKQLIQDLLRLGREEEGWAMADEVAEHDPYDVGVYNLVTLRDELEQFATLESEGFRVRMATNEADVYGQRVLDLLQKARKEFTVKYQHDLPETVLVEIFPRPADFEVRTFGMPGVVGFLGVCFGDVITANSPASQDANPVNFESVLWHEFVHVITLNKTNNRMPRWLSEGISVYEERQYDPSWGERMNVTYRQMILDGELSPIIDMSQMFLSPKSSMHVQFAYFQSSLIVEYIVEQYGFEALLKILDDLAVGISINESISRHVTPLNQLDEEFLKFATKLAEDFGENVDWSPPELAEVLRSPEFKNDALSWAEAHPTNYSGLKMLAEELIKTEERDAAAKILEQAIALFPHETGGESSYSLLASIYREQGDTERELQTLTNLSEIDDDAASAYMRLFEIFLSKEDWGAAERFASKLVRVKPLIAQPHAALAKAYEHLNRPEEAVAAINSLLALNPSDRADLYYRKAVQQRQLKEYKAARRSALQALEEAPRYREALSLLVGLSKDGSISNADSSF